MYDNSKYISGCRTSLLIAIRRGDHILANSAFSAIWNTREQRAWLKWKLPLIVISEVYYMIGEYVEFIKRQKVSNISEEKSYKTFIHLLVSLKNKSKDVDALLRLSELSAVKIEGKYKEIRIVRQLLVDYNSNPKLVLTILQDQLDNMKCEYTQSAGAFLINRIHEGGRLQNIKLMVVCLTLLCIRELPKQQIKTYIKEAVQTQKLSLKIQSKELKDFPWYAFDNKTFIGIQVEKNLVNFFPKIKAFDLCEYFEIDFISNDSMLQPKLNNNVFTCFDNVWWPYYRNKRSKVSNTKWFKVQPKVKREIVSIMNQL